MKNYCTKIAFRGVSPMIWHRLQTPCHVSLADFHHIIQIDNSWDDNHLHHFHIYGKDCGISFVGGMTFSDNPNFVRIDDFEFDVSDRFVYEYNFFEHWLHDIRIKAIETVSKPTNHPSCVKGNGMPDAARHDKGAQVTKALENTKWYLWHGNVERALDQIEDRAVISNDEAIRHTNRKKFLSHLDEMDIYIRNNQHLIPNYGEKWRYGETTSATFVESTINKVVTKRMG